MQFVIVFSLIVAVSGVIVAVVWRRTSNNQQAIQTASGVKLGPVDVARTLLFVNRADEEELERAGVAPVQRQILIDNRPIRSLDELASLDGIGRATLRSVGVAASA